MDSLILTHWTFLDIHLHQALASILRELCDDTNDTFLIENIGVTQKLVATLFWSDSIVFNENSMLASSQISGGIDTDAWCKRAQSRKCSSTGE